MNATSNAQRVSNQKSSRKPRGTHSVQGGSAEANRMAIVILEVLAGGCMPTEAAQRLSVSLPRYYQLEARALEGLVAACEPRPQGKQARPESRIAALEKQLQKAERECVRHQALVRMTQRTAGVSIAKPEKPGNGAKTGRRKRRPAVRALKAASTLRKKVASAEGEAIQQPSFTREAEPHSPTLDSSQEAAKESL